MPSLPRSNVEAAVRRAVLLFRVLAVAWMAVTVGITLSTDDGADVVVVLAALLVAAAGAVWSVRFLASMRPLTKRFLVVDGMVAVVVAIAPQIAGASDPFYGGYPMSAVVVAAFALGLWGGLAAAGIFLLTQSVALFGSAPAVQSPADLVSLAAMAFIIVIVVAQGFGFLTGAERRQAAAEEALEIERRRHAVEQARLSERVQLADDLHDSLLQTNRVLAQQADDPERVRRLARRQERELQSMIERMQTGSDGLAAALRAEAADVEELFSVPVDFVASGDAGFDEALAELVRCAREAMVNAARHSGADHIDVTLEATSDAVTVVVRDRGRGFSLGDGGGGHGLDSVRNRLQRRSGSLSLLTTPGGGTEVEMTMRRGEQ